MARIIYQEQDEHNFLKQGHRYYFKDLVINEADYEPIITIVINEKNY
ncbi:hypothetical protein NWP96_05910 [Mycoplasmopsis cynos]|nr:hypothetical protein [Mycoplasmopsis cynos]